MHLIELKGISKTYVMGEAPPVCALSNVSLTVDPGEFVAIMGPSGSGKSTLLAILGLLDKADLGQFLLLGKDIGKMSDNEYARLRNRFFGFIFQMFNLLPRFNVVANSSLPFIYSPTPSGTDKQKVIETLKQIGLGDRLSHRPNQLSGGQQQRVAIARALANKPLVILADEPTGNLDSRSAAEIIKILKDLNAKGNTIIMVTHEPDLASAATRVITMADGAIVSDVKNQEVAPVEIPKEYLRQGLHHRAVTLPGFLNYFAEAFTTLYMNKLRSFLSILGVLIGVAAVIAMLAIGTGAERSIKQSLASLGTNLLMVRTSFQQRGISMGSGTVTRFSFADLDALKKLDSVDKVVPYVNGHVQSIYMDHNWSTNVLGTSPDYTVVRSAAPTLGRFFTDAEVMSRAKVAVIGATVASNLFGNANPIGAQIRINRVNFTVIGQLPTKGTQGFQNADDQIVIPVTTAMYRLLGTDYINYFDIQVHDADSMTDVQNQITPLLMKLHRLSEGSEQSFDVRNMADIQAAASQMGQTLAYLLGAIAAVSLIVGGIGIMNIMLVMVMERTREIGLRKALGAENFDIMVQFVVESVLICVLGGTMGIIFGSLVSFAIALLAGWNTYISFGSIFLAFTFSILTGLIFGLWPALRAAKLQPIVALRYE